MNMLFVDDIILFGTSTREEWEVLHDLLDTFCCVTRIMINFDKSLLLSHNVDSEVLDQILALFPAQMGVFEDGMKYLGYFIKANCYRMVDWRWILGKIDKRIKS